MRGTMEPLTSPMTTPSEPPHRRNSAWRPFAPGLLVGLLVGLVLAASLPAVSAPPPAGHWVGAGAWTNGVVALQAESDHPAVTVSSGSSASPWGLYAGVGSIRELSPSGAGVVAAGLDSAHWTIANRSSGPGFELDYSTLLSVPAPGGLLGPVSIYVNFTAGPSASSESGVASVAFSVTVVGWPWHAAEDQIALGMPLWPNDTSAATLSAAPGAAGTIRCTAPGSTVAFETFLWSDQARALGGSVDGQTVTGATQLTGNGQLTTVSVQFGGAATHARALSYDPSIVVPAPVALPGIPTYAYALTITVAAAAVGAAAFVSIRTGRRPPALLYVD